MSSEALAWAFKLKVKPASVKFTLVALCECANYKTGRIYPSIEHLSEITGQNRKTIIANIAALEKAGVLVDTGERTGKTKQIKVYAVALETVPVLEPSQKRNSSAFARKQSQKRDTEPSKEPSRLSNIARARLEKPDGVSDGVWADFLAHRKRLKADLTATALAGIEREAEKAGWSLEAALSESITRGWRSFKADWVKEKDDGRTVRGHNGASADRRSGLARALDRQIAGGGAREPLL